MSRVLFRGERFLIRRRGKPMAALVPAADLERLPEAPGPRGLLAAAGAWADYDGLDDFVRDIYRQRENASDRPVEIES